MASLRGHLCVRVEISTRFLGVKLSDRMIGGSRCQSTVGLEQSGAPQAAPSERSSLSDQPWVSLAGALPIRHVPVSRLRLRQARVLWVFNPNELETKELVNDASCDTS